MAHCMMASSKGSTVFLRPVDCITDTADESVGAENVFFNRKVGGKGGGGRGTILAPPGVHCEGCGAPWWTGSFSQSL